MKCWVWLLIVDDIGSERDPTGYALGLMDEPADSRLRKWTVWTANLTLGSLAQKMDTRIASRMLRNESVVVEIQAFDYNTRDKEAAG